MSKEKQIDDSIYGRYGCWWEGGTGVSPEGNQCGECYPNYEDECPHLKKYRQIEEMAKITIVHCELDNQCGSCHWLTCNECLADVLYNAGYRKQEQGV